MKKHLTFLVQFLSIILIILSVSSCKEDGDEFEIYHGTLTVLQKDAYSKVPGRNHLLWPPHTTTVLKWNEGEEVQINHGTDPSETDSLGNYMLEEVKVYHFNGTKEKLEELQEAYKEAVCDSDTNFFLDLENGQHLINKSFIGGLIDYIMDEDNKFDCKDPSVTREKLAGLLKEERIGEFLTEVNKCDLDKSKWKEELNKVLIYSIGEAAHNIKDYHVCNNDADLQVRLIKNFIATGKVEMPEKKCDGPMIFYFPN